MKDKEKTDERYMRRCLQLARCGQRGAAPNPMVGAVIVCNGRIIGEGYHMRCGEAHAEVNAIASVKTPELLRQSTIYVSLEPCAHYGKTPPCAQLIIDKDIPHVVVGCRDPFGKVNGRGIEMLREAGIEVRVGVLEKECQWLNRRFFTYHTQQRPYITLKWAQSQDGFIDRLRTSKRVPPIHFSTPVTQVLVHQLRAEHDAILVGHRTLELDCPSLTVRYWTGRNPLPVVLSSKCLSIGHETVAVQGDAVHILMKELYQRGIQSLLVEGGAQTLQSFIEAGLWDEARVESAQHLRLGSGVAAPHLDGEPTRSEIIDDNRIDYYTKKLKTPVIAP